MKYVIDIIDGTGAHNGREVVGEADAVPTAIARAMYAFDSEREIITIKAFRDDEWENLKKRGKK